jgi:hypothetical protein
LRDRRSADGGQRRGLAPRGDLARWLGVPVLPDFPVHPLPPRYSLR